MLWRAPTYLAPSENWEPPELRILKEQLAHLSCVCYGCEKYKWANIDKLQKHNKHQAIQTKVSEEAPQKTTDVTHSGTLTDSIPANNSLQKDGLCSNCYMTMNFLRSGVIKVLKDQEVETKPEMFTCDKSTEKSNDYLNKTTSLTCKPVLKYKNLIYNDTRSDLSSVDSIYSNRNRESIQREVTFAFKNNYYSDDDMHSTLPVPVNPSSPQSQELSTDSENEIEEPERGLEVYPTENAPGIGSLVGDFICIDSYMQAIRPPWPDETGCFDEADETDHAWS